MIFIAGYQQHGGTLRVHARISFLKNDVGVRSQQELGLLFRLYQTVCMRTDVCVEKFVEMTEQQQHAFFTAIGAVAQIIKPIRCGVHLEKWLLPSSLDPSYIAVH